jgi:hypothetical protein
MNDLTPKSTHGRQSTRRLDLGQPKMGDGRHWI